MLIPVSVRKLFRCVLPDADSDDEADEALLNVDADLNADVNTEVNAEVKAETDVVALLHAKFMDAKHMAEIKTKFNADANLNAEVQAEVELNAEVEAELNAEPTQCNRDKVQTFSVIVARGMVYCVTQYTPE